MRKLGLLLMGLCTGLTLLSPIPTHADTNVTSDGSGSMAVTASIASSFSVLIPSTKTIGNGTSNASNIVVNTDLAPNEYITVTAPNTFTMTQNGISKNGTVSLKGDTTFTGKNSDSNISVVLNIEGLTAGNWSGSIEFTVSKN